MIHPARNNIVLRWVLAVLVLGGGAVLIHFLLPAPMVSQPVEPNLEQPQTSGFPSPEEAKLLRSVARSVALGQGSSDQVDFVDPTLLTAAGSSGKNLVLSLVSLGRKRFAVINGRVFHQGDTLDDGRIVRTISAKGVLLTMGSREERLLWIPPLRVELKKPETQPMATAVPMDSSTQALSVKTTEGRPMTPEELMDALRKLGAGAKKSQTPSGS